MPSRCLIWIKQLATNYLLTLNKLAFLLSGAVNHQHSWTHAPSSEITFTRCNERHRPLYAVWAVGENKRNSMTFITCLRSFSFPNLERRQFSLSLRKIPDYYMWAFFHSCGLYTLLLTKKILTQSTLTHFFQSFQAVSKVKNKLVMIISICDENTELA